MPKKPKKVSSVSRKRRPKSVFKKMWETRRANKEKENATDIVKAQAALNEFKSETSAGDALLRMSMMHRDDQLCCFVGDMSALRSQRAPLHAPVMLTRTQAEAIEEFLIDHGYSMWGKGSGLMASVSTNPNKAA